MGHAAAGTQPCLPFTSPSHVCHFQVHVVTKEDVHPELFKGANTRFKEKDWRGMAAEVHNATDRTAEQEAARLGRALKRDRAR